MPAAAAAMPAKTAPGSANLIVLGRDDAGKSHASWFGHSEAKLARKAAALMGMAALPVANDELKVLADRLPHGRVFASGKAFVPFVKGEVYRQLLNHLSAAEKERLAAVEAAQAEKAAAATPPAEPLDLPADWSKIKVGSLVVAWESEDDGWWEAKVIDISDGDLFTLRWRDFPNQPVIVRRSRHIALLHADFAAA